MGTVGKYELRIRGGSLLPGDYIKHFKATVIHSYNDMGTMRLKLDRESPNGNRDVTVTPDRTFEIVRPVYVDIHDD